MSSPVFIIFLECLKLGREAAFMGGKKKNRLEALDAIVN